MEAQRAADCVGERIESTERWRVQEIVHTPGFSSLAAELLPRPELERHQLTEVLERPYLQGPFSLDKFNPEISFVQINIISLGPDILLGIPLWRHGAGSQVSCGDK